MARKDKLTEIYLYIKDLNNKGKYKDVVKYADRYFELNDLSKTRVNRVKFMKAKALKKLERFDEAIKILESNLYTYDSYYALELFFTYYYLNMYEYALNLLPALYKDKEKLMKNYALYISELIMKKQLGMHFYIKKDIEPDYVVKQIVKYDFDLTLEHIHKHQSNDEDNKSYFKENINLNYLIECIKNNLKDSKKANVNEVMEIHYFSVPNIGYCEENSCNFIKVVLIPNTQNILSLYPTSWVDDKFIPLDCDLDKLFNVKNKVKTMSNIDKFNKRYNM